MAKTDVNKENFSVGLFVEYRSFRIKCSLVRSFSLGLQKEAH